jgi:hypothetical protein
MRCYRNQLLVHAKLLTIARITPNRLEPNPPIHNIIHNAVILLLDVPNDGELLTAGHRQTHHRGRFFHQHPQIRQRNLKINICEMHLHARQLQALICSNVRNVVTEIQKICTRIRLRIRNLFPKRLLHKKPIQNFFKRVPGQKRKRKTFQVQQSLNVNFAHSKIPWQRAILEFIFLLLGWE